jgi:hypothetical protein
MRVPALLSAALTVALAASAGAAPFKPSIVPASALWICHADADGLRRTEAGRLLLARPEWRASPGVSGFAARYGLDPARDMRGLTIYTVGTGRLDAVAVIDPEPAAAARLKGWRVANGWTAKPFEGHAVYSRAAGTDTLFQAVAPSGLIVAGMTLEHVRLGLAVMDGRLAALGSGSLPALADRKNGAGDLLLAAAHAPGADMVRVLPQLSLLKNADSLYVGFGEADGVITGRLTVSAPDAAEAERVEKALAALLDVLRAMGVSGGGDALRGVSVTREGGKVRADGRWKTGELMSLLGLDQARNAVQR